MQKVGANEAISPDVALVTDESIADDLEAFIGYDAIFGVTHWRSPTASDACRCDLRDARVMGEDDDIEAEARALAAKRTREREIHERATRIELLEATKAREAARPKWMRIALPAAALLVVGAAVVLVAMGRPGEHPLDTLVRMLGM